MVDRIAAAVLIAASVTLVISVLTLIMCAVVALLIWGRRTPAIRNRPGDDPWRRR